MAANDIFIYTNAASVANAVVTSQTVTTAADFPDLVLGDSPTYNFYFTNGTASWPTWAGNAQYSVEWALGTTSADDSAVLSYQTQVTAITGGWSIRLPLNTGAVLNQLNNARVSQEFPVVRVWQQLRITDPSGYKTTYATIRTNLRLRTAPDGQVLPDDPLPSGYRHALINNAGGLADPNSATFFANTPLLFSKNLGNSAGTDSVVKIYGDVNDATGDFLQITTNNDPSLDRALLKVKRNGGVQVWDFFAVWPNAQSDYGSLDNSMLIIRSDLGATGNCLKLISSEYNHDIATFYAMSNIGPPIVGSEKFLFGIEGLLCFGARAANIAALKTDGAKLLIRNGTDNAYSNLQANVATLQAVELGDTSSTTNAIQWSSDTQIYKSGAGKVIIGGAATALYLKNTAASGTGNAAELAYYVSSDFFGTFRSSQIKSIQTSGNNCDLVFSTYSADSGLLESLRFVAAGTKVQAQFGAGVVAEHADNAAAVTAGLAVGTVYRTGDVLKIVHA